jgi:capsid protein
MANPVEYHVLKQHPGDVAGSIPYGLDYDRIPADSVIHWFRADRPGQTRGIPDITPALPLFAQLRRFTLAVKEDSETGANKLLGKMVLAATDDVLVRVRLNQ